MSILGALVRTRPPQLAEVCRRLQALPGVDVALNPGDGRLVVVLEDGSTPCAAVPAEAMTAADTLAHIATWAEVISTSLVYEYSGTDAPAATAATAQAAEKAAAQPA